MKAVGELLPAMAHGRGSGRGEAVAYFEMASGVPLWIREADLHASECIEVTDWTGRRATVFPLCFIDGQPVYPRYDLPPGEERRAAEAAIDARYDEWMRRKRSRSERPSERSGW